MRNDGKTHARKAVSLKVGFVSAVQDPAHEGAKSLVLKTREKKPMQTGEQVLKSAFTAALAARKLETDLDNMFETTWTLRRALRESAEAIAKDDSITDKQSALMDSVNEYLDAQKQLAEQIIKPSEPVVKTVIMTPEQAEYYNTLDDVNKSAFIDMQDDARDALVSVAKSKDESLVVDGETILKSKVGESVFKQLKNMQAEINKSKEAEKVAKAKKLVDEKFKHLPGEESVKTKAMLAIQSLPAEQAESIVKMLESGENALQGRFEPSAQVHKKEAKTFEQLVADYIVAHPGTKRSQAKMIVAGTAEGKKAIEAEEKGDDK